MLHVRIITTQRCGILLLAATALVHPAQGADDELDELYRESGSCTRTAVSAVRSCRSEAQGEGWVQRGACNIQASREERSGCEEAARTAAGRIRDLCDEQFEARLEVCAALGDRQRKLRRAPAAEKKIPFKDARLKIELNATDKDAGIQLFIDADPWKFIEVYDPKGVRVFRSVTRGSLGKQGGTELFLESAEPNFSELSLEKFLERFPEGEYEVTGEGLEGEKFASRAKFTHNIPDGPVLVAPTKNALVDRNSSLVVQWRPVAAPNGSPIVGYQVIIVKPDTGIPALPKIALDVMMPPTATSMTVPAGFLLPNSMYEWEVLAIEATGNQTISTSSFRTMP